MLKVKLPISAPVYQNIDDVALTQASAALIDGYIDEAGAVNKRPGLLEFVDVGGNDGIDGVYWWESQGILIVVSGGNIYKITTSEGAFTDITGDKLNVGTPVSFATTGSDLIMANGTRMVRSSSGGTTAYIADSDAPTSVTHVAFLDQYILASAKNTGRFHWSNVNDPTTWNALSFATAEADPDNLLALHVGWREIMLFGSQGVETWYDDGTSPFARLSGGYVDRGCGAPNSVVFANNRWYWLDNLRKIVVLDGRSPQIISTPFDRVIQELSRVDDCIAYPFEASGRHFIVFTFPSADLTLVYDYASNQWYQWGWWNSALAVYGRFRGQCHAFAADWGFHVAGDHATGKVLKVSREHYADAQDDIRMLRRTSHVTHGTLQRKRSRRLALRLRRGDGIADSTSAQQLMLRWRDDNGNWSNERFADLGKTGERELTARLHRLGVYRSRQYEFVLSDGAPFVLVEAEEEMEVLGS